MMAATSNTMSVTSCRASHTNCRNVFGGFGGITFEPNVSLLLARSSGLPESPKINNVCSHHDHFGRSTQFVRMHITGVNAGLSSSKECYDFFSPTCVTGLSVGLLLAH